MENKKEFPLQPICVITGGSSGIGLATAHAMGKDYQVIIVGRNEAKLAAALKILEEDGITALSYSCDAADEASVSELAAYAQSIGRVRVVIHAAGLSPHMGDAQKILAVNALGTIYINDAFFKVMEEGSCLIDVSSMSGYFIPSLILPQRHYRLSLTDTAAFQRKMLRRINLFPSKLRSSLAYGISKNFILWLVKAQAEQFGSKGIRILSVSPGSFETPMGELEKEGVTGYIEKSALKRLGKVEEIASLLAFCSSDKPSYLTGTDILCDGGCVAGTKIK